MKKASRIAATILTGGVFALCVCAGWALTSCVKDEPKPGTDPDTDKQKTALSVNGKEIYQYDENTWQSVHISPDNLVLMTTDSGDRWYRLRCDAFPSEEGQTVRADLTYRVAGSRDGVKTVSGLSLTVAEIDVTTGLVSLKNTEKGVELLVLNAQ